VSFLRQRLFGVCSSCCCSVLCNAVHSADCSDELSSPGVRLCWHSGRLRSMHRTSQPSCYYVGCESYHELGLLVFKWAKIAGGYVSAFMSF